MKKVCIFCYIVFACAVARGQNNFATPPTPTLTYCDAQISYQSFPGKFLIGADSVNASASTFGKVITWDFRPPMSCGIIRILPGSWIIQDGVASLTLTFDKPVSNIQFDIAGTNTESYEVRASLENEDKTSALKLSIYDGYTIPRLT